MQNKNILIILGLGVGSLFLWNYLKKNQVNGEVVGDNLGDHTATQDLNMDGFPIVNVAEPFSLSDAATKNYIDNTIEEILVAINGAIVPIGGVTAWLKSFENTPPLPSGFVECNGQTLYDSDSVYDGQAIPNLNGNNNFLRGNLISGGTGGSDTIDLAHAHAVSGTTGAEGGIARLLDLGYEYYFTQRFHQHTFSTTSDSSLSPSQSTLPPYYDIVWIMRIK